MFDEMGNPVVMFDILDLETKRPIDADTSDLRMAMESFEYDESLDKVGQLVLTFNNENGWLDDDDRLRGQDKMILFRWGYLTHLSPEKTAVIRYSVPDYPANGKIKLKVYAWDAVSRAFRRSHPRNWGRVPTTQIAQEVAYRWDLIPIIPVEDDDRREKAYIQPGKMSDLRYLKRLAKQKGWECWSDGVNLFYGPDSYDEKPVLAATYRSGLYSNEANVAPIVLLSFKPEINQGKTPSTRRISVDPKQKKVATHKSDDVDATKDSPIRKNISQFALSFEKKVGEFKSIPDTDMEAGAGKVEPTPEPTPEQVKKDAKARHWKITRKGSKASAKFVGNPELRTRRIVEILGVSETHAGKWKITGAKHRITASGNVYEVTCRLKRPGRNKGKKDKKEEAGNENKKQADTQTAKAEKITVTQVDFKTKEATIVTRTQ